MCSLLALVSVEHNPPSPRLAFVLACLAGLAINALIFKPGWRFDANRDFLGLYPGGKLAGSAQLYDPPSVLREQRKAVGFTNARRMFVRPPFYALVLWPLARLPFPIAFAVYQAFMLAAVIAFVWLWRIPGRAVSALACCWSMPLIGSFAIGQDVPLLLCVIAASYALLSRGYEFAAGMLFSLCAIKPHLFLPLPIFVIARRQWAFGAGVALGGLILAALSVLGAGLHWLPLFLQAATQAATNPGTELMPNLKGLFGGHLALEGAASCALFLLLWFVGRSSELSWSFAALLATGLLTSHHAYVEDCAILIPALLIAFDESSRVWQRLLALCLLTPFAYVWLFLTDGLITRLLLLFFALSLVAAPQLARYSRSEAYRWRIAF